MEPEILEEDNLKAQPARFGVAADCSLGSLLSDATTIKEVIWQLQFYVELLAELMCKGWELTDRPEGTWLFLHNPRYPASSEPSRDSRCRTIWYHMPQ